MTFNKFRHITPREQVTWPLVTGTFLAQRWEDGGKVRLYHLSDRPAASLLKFVEVGHDAIQQRAVVLRSFSDSEALEDYAHGVRLPE